MGFIAQAFWFGDASWLLSILPSGGRGLPARRMARTNRFGWLVLDPLDKLSHRVLMSPPIVIRWPRDRRYIVGVKTARGWVGGLTVATVSRRTDRGMILSLR